MKHFIGGKGANRKYVPHFNEKPKEVVMGMLQRDGNAYLKHIPNTGKITLMQEIQKHVEPNTRIITDQYAGYTNLHKYGYLHDVVNHSKTYVLGKDIYTNSIEGVWANLKEDSMESIEK